MINKIKSKEKEALLFSELMGYKHKETADILNITEANVKVLVFRAKRKLKV